MPLPLILLTIALLLPMGVFLLLTVAGRLMGTTVCGAVGTVGTLLSFSCCLICMMQWLNGGVLAGVAWGAGAGPLSATVLWTPDFIIGLHVDALTIVVTTAGLLVSSAIHVFATGYLRHDIRGPRSFALMGLSNAALIGLMTSPSLAQWAAWAVAGSMAAMLLSTPVPLGPGGLGITPVPRGLTVADLGRRASAALTMLVVRCLGDAALLLACGILVARAPGLSWQTLWTNCIELPASDPVGWLLIAAACFHASAFPVCFFLPDAKGAPTPMAALAYGVTLLPAGVLLLARVFPLLSETHLLALSIIGALTLIISAVGALAESDLRRWLAWTACAGTGAAIAAVGAGSLGGAILQVIATMFGVSILLLAGGSILHACQGERRFSRYGGLLFRMPATAILLAHGAGTYLGGPFLAGSDAWGTMLTHAYRSMQSGQPRGVISLTSLVLGLLLISAALARGYALLMLGKRRDRVVYDPARESATLTVPVAILALIAVVSGHPYLSPVRQLVSLLPREMALLVTPETPPPSFPPLSGPPVLLALPNPPKPSPDFLRLAREVTPPVIPPPPAPEDAEALTENAEVSSLSSVPPDDKMPRLIDPLRWLVAAVGVALGLSLPHLLTTARIRSTRIETLRRTVASGAHLSTATTNAAQFALSGLSAAVLWVDQFVINPVLDTASRISLPLASRRGNHATLPYLLVIITAVLILAMAAATLWHLQGLAVASDLLEAATRRLPAGLGGTGGAAP